MESFSPQKGQQSVSVFVSTIGCGSISGTFQIWSVIRLVSWSVVWSVNVGRSVGRSASRSVSFSIFSIFLFCNF